MLAFASYALNNHSLTCGRRCLALASAPYQLPSKSKPLRAVLCRAVTNAITIGRGIASLTFGAMARFEAFAMASCVMQSRRYSVEP